MESLINGDIYIRRVPGFNPLPAKEKKAVERERRFVLADAKAKYEKARKNIETDESMTRDQKDVLIKVLDGKYKKITQDLKDMGEKMLTQGMPDVKGFRTFWVLDCSGGTIKLVEQTEDKSRRKRNFTSAQEMNKEFMTLREALEKGEYYGNEHYFKQTKDGAKGTPTSGDNQQNDSYAIVTYVFGNRALVDNKVTNEYEVVISDEFMAQISHWDNKNIHDEYRDTFALYQAVLKQVTKKNKHIR